MMLNELLKNRNEIDDIIQSSSSNDWNSLKIRYEKPYVNRLWMPFKNYRLCLHTIYSCEESESFYHPHDWPSACYILNGSYRMKIGTASKVLFEANFYANSCYEMIQSELWHSVHPISFCTSSIMLMGTKYEKVEEPIKRPEKHENVEMTTDEKLTQLSLFRMYI